MPTHSAAARPGHLGRLWLLREARIPPHSPRGTYEHEGSERVSRGSIALPSGTRWLSRLQVPIGVGRPALLTIQREDAGDALAPDEAALVLPLGEADSLVALLRGIIAQARADGVLEDPSGAEPHGPA